MDKHISRVYKDEVIIDSDLTRELALTMVSCIPVETVRHTLSVVHVTRGANPHCRPASIG